MTVTALRKAAKPTRSPAREALASLVSRKAEAHAAVASAQDELTKFDATLERTRDAFYAADQAVDEKQTMRRGFLSMFAGDALAVEQHCIKSDLKCLPSDIDKAVKERDDAKERYTFGKEGRQRLVVALETAREEAKAIDTEIERSIFDVGQEKIAELLTEAERIQHDLMLRRIVLLDLAKIYPALRKTTWAPEHEDPFVQRLRVFLHSDNLPSPHKLNNGVFEAREYAALSAEALAPWQDARVRLLADPDAELPA